MSFSPKLGPLTTPGGLLGGADSAATQQVINATVQVIGPLPKGHMFTVEGDVGMFAIQGSAAAVGIPGAAVISAAALARLGVYVPAGVEAGPFEVGDGDGYIAWVRETTDGTKFRCNERGMAKTS